MCFETMSWLFRLERKVVLLFCFGYLRFCCVDGCVVVHSVIGRCLRGDLCLCEYYLLFGLRECGFGWYLLLVGIGCSHLVVVRGIIWVVVLLVVLLSCVVQGFFCYQTDVLESVL